MVMQRMDSRIKKYQKENSLRNEDNVISLLLLSLLEEKIFFPLSMPPDEIQSLIHSLLPFDGWINSSGKADPTPDYYNPDQRLMMEVMCVSHYHHEDDKHHLHSPGDINISRSIEELCNADLETADWFFQHNNIVKSSFSSDVDLPHSYRQYVDSFTRVVSKHIDEIGTYRNNHPGYKLIFLIYDDSTLYRVKGSNPSDEICYHDALFDESFNRVIRDADIEMIIWLSPFKFTLDDDFRDCISFYNPHHKIDTVQYQESSLEPIDFPRNKRLVVLWTEDDDMLQRHILLEDVSSNEF